MKDLATAQNNTDPSQSDALWAKVNVQIYANNLGRKVTIRPMDMNETTTGDGSIPVKNFDIAAVNYLNYKDFMVLTPRDYDGVGVVVSNNQLTVLVDTLVNYDGLSETSSPTYFVFNAVSIPYWMEANNGTSPVNGRNPDSFIRMLTSNAGNFNESAAIITVSK